MNYKTYFDRQIDQIGFKDPTRTLKLVPKRMSVEDLEYNALLDKKKEERENNIKLTNQYRSQLKKALVMVDFHNEEVSLHPESMKAYTNTDGPLVDDWTELVYDSFIRFKTTYVW